MDALGWTDALLDESQAATDRYQYRAFGLQTQQGGHESPFTFVGSQNYYRDSELELYYAGARYYDPVAGRWLSGDPIGLAAGDVNLYRYVQNNPVNISDPSGLDETGIGGWLVWAGANPDSVATLRGLFTHPLDTVRGHAHVSSLPQLGGGSHAEIAVSNSWTMEQLRRGHAELAADPLNVINPLSHGNAIHMATMAFFGTVFEMAPAATRAAYDDAQLALEDVRENTDSEYVRLVASSGKGLLFVGEVNTELALGLTQAGVIAAPAVELLNTQPAQWIVGRPLVQESVPVVGKGLLRLGQASTAFNIGEGLAEGDVNARDVAYAIFAFGLLERYNAENAVAPRWGADATMRAADEAAGVIVNGRYINNPTARNLRGLLTDTGKIGGKQMSGRFMYVVDDAGDIIIGTRTETS